MEGFVIRGVPVIGERDDLAFILRSLFDFKDGDVLCIASTIVAKAEGMFRHLKDYRPTKRAEDIAASINRDPRFVQAVLDESEEVLLEKPFLLVVTRFGHIGVNAGIDQSNVGPEMILLLPKDPKASAEAIRTALGKDGKDVAVIITDTCGRPFRCGVAAVAVGWAGIGTLRDWRGEADIHGKKLEITLEAVADEIASAANLLMGEAGDGTPAVVFRGLKYPHSGDHLFMPKELDIIRRHLKG